MATPIVLPKLGMTMEEATLLGWFKQAGESVAEGDIVAEVETEKVTFEIQAPCSGILYHEAVEEAVLHVGDRLGLILAVGEEPPPGDFVREVPRAAGARGHDPVGTEKAQVAVIQTRELRASPAARSAARSAGIGLESIAGTGPLGRIKHSDVVQFLSQPAVGSSSAYPSPKVSPLARVTAERENVDLNRVRPSGLTGRIMRADVEEVARRQRGSEATEDTRARLSGMRRTIGRNMHRSLQEMAQLTLNMKVDMTEAVAVRSALVEAWNAEGPRPTYTDMIVRAVALALRDHPKVNARIEGDELVQLAHINIGLSVALEDGLIVPVLRDADTLSLRDIAISTKELAAAAREKRLSPELLEGGTFTVTTLGAWGIESFTPIINPPEAAILGVGSIETEATFVGGQVAPRKVMRLSLSFDHRVLDGAPAATFLQYIRYLLEQPLLLGFR